MHVAIVLSLLALCVALCGCGQALSQPPTSAQIESVGILAYQAKKQSAVEQLEVWANKGLPVAQRELALAYGHLDAEHNTLAVQWLQKAAQAGDAQAQFELAQAWHDGKWGLSAEIGRAHV